MRYNPALDGIRAVAVFLVIAYHAGVVEVSAGYLGVDVFFVLSGYLITTILLREHEAGGVRLWAFYLRRARRLYPALCLLLLGVGVTGMAAWQGAAMGLLYLGDYLGTPGALGHTWSLAVEEHYYLLWPLLLPFVARMERRKAVAVLLAAYVLATAWSAWNGIDFRNGWRFDTRMSGLVFGCLLGFSPTLAVPLTLLTVSMALLALGFDGGRMFTEATTAAVIVLSTMTTLPFLSRPAFTYLGRVSYGMYLFHAPIAFVVLDRMHWQGRLAVTYGASLALAALSYHTVEKWFRQVSHAEKPVGMLPMNAEVLP